MKVSGDVFFRFAAFLVTAALMNLGTPGHAAPDARQTGVWPAPDSAVGVKGRTVQWLSSSPLTPRDIGKGGDNDAQTTALGILFLPPGEHRARSVPAVIMLHGSGGVLESRELAYGAELAAMGIAVLVVDSFGARRDRGADYLARVFNITETMMVADAYSGLRYLATIPEIDPRRAVLAGFSYGAMAAIYAIFAQLADKLSPDGLHFAGHVAFYGPCIARFADARTTGAPLLMLYGAQDEIVSPQRCGQLTDDLRRGESKVETIVYPNAVHQWDGAFERRLIGRNLARCRFTVQPDGTIRDDRLGMDMTSVFRRKISLALWTTGQPYPIGRDDAIRARSNRDFGQFLAGLFY